MCTEKKVRQFFFLFQECVLNTLYVSGAGGKDTVPALMGRTFYLQIHREKCDLSLATQAACSAYHYPRDHPETWEWLHLPLSVANKRKWKTPNACPHSESRTGEGHLSQQGRRGGGCPQPGHNLGMQNRGCCWASAPGQAPQGPCQPREPRRDQYESTSIHAIAI